MDLWEHVINNTRFTMTMSHSMVSFVSRAKCTQRRIIMEIFPAYVMVTEGSKCFQFSMKLPVIQTTVDDGVVHG